MLIALTLNYLVMKSTLHNYFILSVVVLKIPYVKSGMTSRNHWKEHHDVKGFVFNIEDLNKNKTEMKDKQN